MKDKLINTHRFCFNSWDNSGEQLILTTEIYDNGDTENNLYYNQKIKLQSYCNEATFSLYGVSLTPDILRKLADELEEVTRNGQPKNV